MRAIEFDGELKIRTDYPKPEPKQGEALIKVLSAGICNTDIEIMRGYMNYNGILGHEFIGIVESVNGSDQSLVNKRVVGEINAACGSCDYCYSGLKTHCPNRDVLGIFKRNGCFADYITLPVENLLLVSDTVLDDEAVIVEPLAAAFEILEQVHIKPSDKILVLGDGKLGLLIALAMNTTQANLTLVGKHIQKLNIAEKQGVKTILLNELKTERVYDIVIEATGTIGGFEFAQSLVKPRGTIVLKSTVAGDKSINLSPLVVDEITLVGSRCGAFRPALTAIEKKVLDVKPLISKKFKFDDAAEAMELSQAKGILKAIIEFN